MILRHLEILEAIADTGTFTNAAKKLHESRGILTSCRNLDRRISHLEEHTPVHIVSSNKLASYLLPAIVTCLWKIKCSRCITKTPA